MKTIDTIILSLCIGFFIIAIYETIVLGITYSYGLYMVCIGLLFLYSYRRRNREEKEKEEKNKGGKRRS